jgi:hypothetical protein
MYVLPVSPGKSHAAYSNFTSTYIHRRTKPAMYSSVSVYLSGSHQPVPDESVDVMLCLLCMYDVCVYVGVLLAAT